jgi:hypothetical protein
MENIEKVIAIDNKTYPKDSCRFIDGKYYLIGLKEIKCSGHVYLINGRYIRENTNRLVYNHTTMEYELKNNSVIEGIIGFDKFNVPILGYFNLNPVYNVKIVLQNGNENICINESIINLNYREEKSTGIYYHITLKSVLELRSLELVGREYKESLPYDSRGITSKYLKNYNDNYNPIYNDSVEKYSLLLKNYTFGLEFESVLGIIPNNKLNYLPLIPLRDGSIDGIEYVTVPLQHKKGMQALIDSVKELNKRTEYNESCSLHLHIGNIPRTPEFILAFYKLSCYFQEDIFKMFPLYKKYNFGIKRKNYSKPFDFNKINICLEPSIDIKNKDQVNKNFSLIFNYLSEVTPFSEFKYDLNNVKEHPRDPNGNTKWNITNRYYSVNFIPLIFGNKQTVEFRIHTPTYDIGKIINFLLINIYCIDYTINNISEILSNPKFLLKYNNFQHFVEDYIYNHNPLKKGLKNTLSTHQLNYLRERISKTYDGNCNGEISGNEKIIKCNNVINWKNNNLVNYDELYYDNKYVISNENDLEIDESREINNNEKVLKAKKNFGYMPSPFDEIRQPDSQIISDAKIHYKNTINKIHNEINSTQSVHGGFFQQIRERETNVKPV